MPQPTPEIVCDVTVIGGGLAGKAASVHLAKAGLQVVCIEPSQPGRQPVGESLDWSSPELLNALGFPMEELIRSQIATWKKHVILRMRDGAPEHYVPLTWMARTPFHVELRTLHVDRVRLDQELLKTATDAGVTMIRDKAVRIERDGNRISAIHTAAGRRFSSPWFVDASGFATRMLAREFHLPAIDNGPHKAAIWTYFPIEEPIEGTTLYMNPRPSEYLDWIWEIPINPAVVSVGYVTTGDAMKAKREQGLSVEEIFRQEVVKFPRFASLLSACSLGALHITSFRPRVHRGTAGPNWLIAGEAASMVDPITSNGVTAALRHASEASALILKNRQRGELPLSARMCYSSRILQMAKFFNSGIEKVVYEPPVRNRIGLRNSGTIYISPAWGMNLLYARVKPNGVVSTFLFGLVLRFFRVSAWIFHQLCKRLPQAAEVPS
jgi:flavin-dependent dehydrogenase